MSNPTKKTDLNLQNSEPSTMNNTNELASSMAQNTQINAIRDIIFGQNMQDYEQRFAEMERTMHRYRQEQEATLQQTADNLAESIKILETKLLAQLDADNKKIAAEINILQNNKLDRFQLGKLLIDLGTKISAV